MRSDRNSRGLSNALADVTYVVYFGSSSHEYRNINIGIIEFPGRGSAPTRGSSDFERDDEWELPRVYNINSGLPRKCQRPVRSQRR